MVAPGLCDRVASPGEGLSICSCRSAMYHISPRFARESFVFAKKCGESAHTSPAKPGSPQKSIGIGLSLVKHIVTLELRCQLVSVGGAGGSSGGMGS